MFRIIKHKWNSKNSFRNNSINKTNKVSSNNKNQPSNISTEEKENTPKLPLSLEEKHKLLKPYIDKNADINYRSFLCFSTFKAAVIYLKGMIDENRLEENILKPIFNSDKEGIKNSETLDNIDKLTAYLYNSVLSVGQVQKVTTIKDLVDKLFEGKLILLIDNNEGALTIGIEGGEIRSLDEPLLDTPLCGPREGFIEDLTTNITIIRRKLKDPNLVVTKRVVGKRTKTEVAIMYVQDIADDSIVNKILGIIEKIDIDGILSTGYINQYIEDNPYSIFPSYRTSERADIVTADLLEGRVAILADQSPLAIIYPALFIELMQASEDYIEKPIQGLFMRIFRIIAFFVSTSLPALYISLLSFQQQLIPFNLIIPLAIARREVPFPVAVAIILLEIIVQLIFEAGIRLPTPIGQTVGVVSGIILGQALVAAKLASPAVIIVVSISTISTFAIPNFCLAMTIKLIKVFLIISAAVFGLYGFSIAWLILVVHMISQESVGVPYMSPIAPTRYADFKDSIFRTFLWKMNRRPDSIPIKDKYRQGNNKGDNNG